MTYPDQQGSWPDPSWPAGQAYPASAAPASEYPPQALPPGYGPQYPPYAVPAPRGTNSMAIAAFVLALVGLFTCGLGSLAGAIMGHVARRQIAESGEDGDGLAVAGIAVGWSVFGLHVLVIVGYVIFFVLLAAAVTSGTTTPSTDSTEWDDLLRATASLSACVPGAAGTAC